MTRCFLRTGPLGSLRGESLSRGTAAFESIAPLGPWSQPGGVALPGEVIAGTYETVASALKCAPSLPAALILLFSKGTGMETFLETIRGRYRNVPCAGGAAARGEVAGCGFVFPEGSEVVAITLWSGTWTTQTIHFHRPTGERLRIVPRSPRCFAEVEVKGRRRAARPYFEDVFHKLDVREKVWDRCTLRCDDGRLLHLSVADNMIFSGSDLPSGGNVEIAVFDQSFGERDRASAIRPGSLVFACAGLYGLLKRRCLPVEDPCLAHLYGEIVTSANGPAFANLSVTLLTPASEESAFLAP